MEQNKRNSGIDLIRCTAFLFVVIFHSFLYNGYYGYAQKGAAVFLCDSLRGLSISCIGLFLMITGYLQYGKTNLKDCKNGFRHIISCYIPAAMINIAVRHYFLNDKYTFGEWAAKFFRGGALVYGWYVAMYAGLLLLIPYINRALHTLDRKGLLSFCGILIILTAIPGIVPSGAFPSYWKMIYPITYYVLGAAVRRIKPQVNPFLCLGGAAALSLAFGCITVLSTDKGLDCAFTFEFQDIYALVSALLIFIGLYRLQIPRVPSRILEYGAGGCYGGYLLCHLADVNLYRLVPQWHNPQSYCKLFICVTLPIFIMSVLCGRVLEKLCALPFRHKGLSSQNK